MSIDIKGCTALITGASSGIGREIARLLAREAGALVLVARRADRLAELERELAAGHPALRVLVRSVDLLDRAAAGTTLDGLERDGVAVDVLINNAGFGMFGLFEESDWKRTEEMIELDVVSATFLLHRLVPGMVKRGFGAVLNVGSTAGMFPLPGLGVYAASKAYVNLLSDVLHAELAEKGVSVTALCPGPVPTEFQQVAGTTGRNPIPEAFHVSAAQCAEEAVAGLKAGKARVIPGAGVRAGMLSVEVMPRPAVRAAARVMARRTRARR